MNERKRVLHVAIPLDRGGVLSFLRGLGKAMTRTGEVESSVCYVSSSDLHQDFQRDDIAATRLGGSIREFVQVRRRLIETVLDVRPHIIHAHGLYDVLLASSVASKLQIPVVHTVHGAWYSSQASRLKGYLYDIAYRSILSKVKKVVVVNPAMVRQMCEKFGLPASEVTYIANGVELKRTSVPKATSVSADDPIVVGFVGRLSQEKGVDIAIEAFADIHRHRSSTRLKIIGDGPLRKDAEASVRAGGLENAVEFAGWLADVEPELVNIDVLLLPSRTEGMPLIVLEALSLGIPVVASDVGALGTLVFPGINGQLLTKPSSGAVARAVLKIISDPETLLQYKSRAYSSVGEQHSMSRVAEDYLRLYWRTTNDVVAPEHHEN